MLQIVIPPDKNQPPQLGTSCSRLEQHAELRYGSHLLGVSGSKNSLQAAAMPSPSNGCLIWSSPTWVVVNIRVPFLGPYYNTAPNI